jgi:hypothetical protein
MKVRKKNVNVFELNESEAAVIAKLLGNMSRSQCRNLFHMSDEDVDITDAIYWGIEESPSED